MVQHSSRSTRASGLRMQGSVLHLSKDSRAVPKPRCFSALGELWEK